MLKAPDEARQHCLEIANLLREGQDIFEPHDRNGGFFLRGNEQYRDKALEFEQAVMQWITTVQMKLYPDEIRGFDDVLNRRKNPTWQQALAVAIGKQAHTFTNERGHHVDVADSLMRIGMELLDYLKALYVQRMPPSPLDADFQARFANQFRKMSDFTIDDIFIKNGCFDRYRVHPHKSTSKKSLDRVQSWLDGLNLYVPDQQIEHLKAVQRSYRQHKKIPLGAPADAIQRELDLFAQPAPTNPLSVYTLHPIVEHTAGRFWVIGEYDTALSKVCIALDMAVQTKSGLRDSGVLLMQTVFSDKNPKIKIPERFGNQKGFMFLFAGVMDAIRNPRAHHDKATLSQEEALEWLVFLSALFRVLDASSVVTPEAV